MLRCIHQQEHLNRSLISTKASQQQPISSAKKAGESFYLLKEGWNKERKGKVGNNDDWKDVMTTYP